MKRETLAVLVLGTLTAWSCNGDRGPVAPPSALARTEVLLTDTLPPRSVRSVNVYIDEIDASEASDTGTSAASQAWTTVVSPHQRYDLLTLQNGTTALLGTAQLSPKQFRALRVVLDTDSSGIVRTDGTAAPVYWGRAGQITVNTIVEAPLQISGNARILLDFNVANSFAPDPSNPKGFVFLPWIRATSSSS